MLVNADSKYVEKIDVKYIITFDLVFTLATVLVKHKPSHALVPDKISLPRLNVTFFN